MFKKHWPPRVMAWLHRLHSLCQMQRLYSSSRIWKVLEAAALPHTFWQAAFWGQTLDLWSWPILLCISPSTPFQLREKRSGDQTWPTEECASLHMPQREHRTGEDARVLTELTAAPKQELIPTSAKELSPSLCPCTACFRIKNNFFFSLKIVTQNEY